MITILYIIFCFNCFIAGVTYVRSEDESMFDRLTYVVAALSIGWLIIFYLLLIEPVLEYLEETFQVKFWFSYLFTRKYYKLPIEKLEEVNLAVNRIHTTSSLKDRVFRFCIRLINKRNTYTPVSSISNLN